MCDPAAAASTPGVRPGRICVSFDLDGTLWPPAGPVLAAAGVKLRDWLEANHSAVAAAFAGDPDLGKLMMTVAEERPDLRHCFTALRREALRRAADFAGADPDVVAEGGMAVFRAARNDVVPYPGVASAMRGLASSGAAVVTLTNGNAQLEATPLAGLAVAALSATSAGAAKPSRAMFDAVVSATGVPAEATVHVGDDPEADVRGAKQAGMRAILVVPPPEDGSDHDAAVARAKAAERAMPADERADAVVARATDVVSVLRDRWGWLPPDGDDDG